MIEPNKHSVLIAEDDSNIRSLIEEILKLRGYKVTIACDGKEALQYYNSKPNSFDLLITDYHMPHLDGLELLKSVKSHCPDFPVILCSANKDLEKKIQPPLPDGFLAKPYLAKDLNGMMKTLYHE